MILEENFILLEENDELNLLDEAYIPIKSSHDISYPSKKVLDSIQKIKDSISNGKYRSFQSNDTTKLKEAIKSKQFKEILITALTSIGIIGLAVGSNKIIEKQRENTHNKNIADKRFEHAVNSSKRKDGKITDKDYEIKKSIIEDNDKKDTVETDKKYDKLKAGSLVASTALLTKNLSGGIKSIVDKMNYSIFDYKDLKIISFRPNSDKVLFKSNAGLSYAILIRNEDEKIVFKRINFVPMKY